MLSEFAERKIFYFRRTKQKRSSEILDRKIYNQSQFLIIGLGLVRSLLPCPSIFYASEINLGFKQGLQKCCIVTKPKPDPTKAKVNAYPAPFNSTLLE